MKGEYDRNTLHAHMKGTWWNPFKQFYKKVNKTLEFGGEWLESIWWDEYDQSTLYVYTEISQWNPSLYN
jgi:hypothetical protein